MKQNLLILIYIVFLQSYQCDIIKCGDKLGNKNMCMLETSDRIGETKQSISYVRGCPEGTVCSLVDIKTHEVPGYCIPKVELVDEGGECKYSNECRIGNCKGNKCTGLSEGSDCANDKYCTKGTFCHFETKKCTKYFKKGEECYVNEDSSDLFRTLSYCEFGTLCGKLADGYKCVELFSLPDGTECDNSYLCQGGNRINGKCASSTIKNDTCIEPYDQDSCEVEYNLGESKITMDESCLIYQDLTKVCPHQSDSQVFKDFVDLYKKELAKFSEKDIKAINLREFNRMTFNNKKLFKAGFAFYAQNYYRKELNLKDQECLMEFYASMQNSKYIHISYISILIFGIISLFS